MSYCTVTKLSKQLTSVESDKKTVEVAFEAIQQKVINMQDITGNKFAGSLDEQLKAISILKRYFL